MEQHAVGFMHKCCEMLTMLSFQSVCSKRRGILADKLNLWVLDRFSAKQLLRFTQTELETFTTKKNQEMHSAEHDRFYSWLQKRPWSGVRWSHMSWSKPYLVPTDRSVLSSCTCDSTKGTDYKSMKEERLYESALITYQRLTSRLLLRQHEFM